jgi:hypothetical protein
MNNLKELLTELEHLSKQPPGNVNLGRLTKVKELLGEVGAHREVTRIYGSSRLRHVSDVPRRGEKGAFILDLLFELDDGQLVLVEAKYGGSQMGRTADRRTFLVTTSKDTVEKIPLHLKRQIEQLDALWIKDRIKEIAKTNAPLAQALREAVDGERLKVLEVRSRVDLETGRPPVLASQTTDHTDRLREQAKTGRRFVDEERRFARREALAERQLKALAAKTKELEQVAKDARKAQKAAQSKLDRSRASLANLKETPGKPLTKRQVAARLRWTQAIEEEGKALEALKKATADAEAALARHTESVRDAKKITELDTRARKAEEQFKRLHEAERLKAGAASGKLDDAARGLLDRRTAPTLQATPEPVGKLAATTAKTAADKPPQPTATPGQTTGSKASGAGERAISTPMTVDKALANPLNAQRGLASDAPAAQRLATAANELDAIPQAAGRGRRAAQLGLKGLKVVARVGRLVFSVLNFANPIFNLLDAVALVDALVAWLKRDKIEEEKEWARIGAYLFSQPQVVRTIYGINYYTGMGNHLEGQFRTRMADPRYADNILFWISRWGDPKWSGFVYLTVDTELERQESNEENDPYRVKFYWDTIPLMSFSDKPPPNTRRKTIIKNAGPQDESNRSTEGKPAPYSSPEYNIAVEISMLKVRYTYPQPYLTPFDFMIMKCNNLIASIMEFVSRYDERIISEMDISDEVFEGIRVYWLNKHEFSAPLDSGVVHRSLLNLLEAVRVLSLHAHGRGDSKRAPNNPNYNNGYFRRREILTKLYANNPKLRNLRLFDFVEAQLGQLLTKQLSKRENDDIDYLMQQAASIGADLKRTLERCKAPTTALAFNYEGKPAK